MFRLSVNGSGTHARSRADGRPHRAERPLRCNRNCACDRGDAERDVAEAAFLASLADETPEGRSIAALARGNYGLGSGPDAAPAQTIAFSAQTRISGVDVDGRSIRKGAVDAILTQIGTTVELTPPVFREAVQAIARSGGTPLAVSEGSELVGAIHLKDVVKPEIKTRFAALRRMGIKTVMVTGDNSVTAAPIASEAGVDDYIAEATPQDKLADIKSEQARGRLIAMCGEIGKQLLMTRGSLTTFSIANDVAKYFAIIPALFVATYPELGALNVMHLATPQSAILSAIIFNALIIVALIPLALKGVAYRPSGAATLLTRNLLIYGAGGLVAPFVGIKIVDLAVSALGLA